MRLIPLFILLPAMLLSACQRSQTYQTRRPFPATRPGEVITTTLAELGNFDFDAENGSPIPDDVKALSGSTVRVNGYMVPIDAADDIGKFALVPALPEGHNQPQIQHVIVVTCPKGKTVKYCADPITVEGNLTVEVIKDDGYIVSIFELEPTSVKPVAK